MYYKNFTEYYDVLRGYTKPVKQKEVKKVKKKATEEKAKEE